MKGKYLLFVGTIQPRKNLEALIGAFGKADLSREYRLVIAGAAGWQTAAVYRAAKASRCEERIVFTGRVTESELAELYRQASLYVQPSWTEGFGLPVLEAMRAGVPVLVSDGGALPEVVGEAGRVIALGKGFEERLAAAIRELTMDNGVRQQLTKLGKERANELTWERAARESLEAILRA